MSDKFVSRWFYAELKKYKEGVFFKEDKYSQQSVNFDDFAERLRSTYDELDENGFDVVSIVPIQMGQSDPCVAKRDGLIFKEDDYVGDVGYSITRGAVVIGKKR